MARLGFCSNLLLFRHSTIHRFNSHRFISHRLKTTSPLGNVGKVIDGTEKGTGSVTRSSGLDLEFSDCKEAYRSKTTMEIARAFLVFKLCQLDHLVTYNKEVTYCSCNHGGRNISTSMMQSFIKT